MTKAVPVNNKFNSHSKEENSPLSVLFEILARLDQRAVNWALLHDERDTWDDNKSDVDLAFAGNPRFVMEPVLREFEDEGKLVILQRLHYEILSGYYYIVKIAGSRGLFLHLDCLFDPFGVNRYHLSTSYLLEGKLSESSGFRIASDKEALYLLMKRAIKGMISQQQLDKLHQSLDPQSETLWEEVRRWFGHPGAHAVESLMRLKRAEDANVTLVKLRDIVERRFQRCHPMRYLIAKCLTMARQLSRLFNPTGQFVVILGPDGSGKSTVSGLVASQLERAFRKTWRFHWRPNLLPKLGRDAASTPKRARAEEGPPETSKYKGIISLLRFLYYWMDFVCGYWLVIYLRKAQATLIIGERYFPDVVVNPHRYGFAVPPWLLRIAAKTVPSPDLTVLLKGDPQVIFTRKPELSIATISKQIREYEKELPLWDNSVIISTESSAIDIATQISDLILHQCARRICNS
jgi:thymidylate kinase